MARLYRFALLLAGDEGRAGQALYEACAESAGRLGGTRNADGRMACMLGALRRKLATGEGATGSGGLGGAFATLPEEERVALAGLYTGLLPAKALAEALKMPLEQMGRVLKNGRERLAGIAPAMNEAVS